MTRGFAIAAVLLFGGSTASAREFYRDRIPNGHSIGCIACHSSTAGGDARNVFGVAFQANGFVWSRNLAELDSDSDRWSNGQELGDPFGQWSQGGSFSPRPWLSRPGFSSSEPSDRNLCNYAGYTDCQLSGGSCSSSSSNGRGDWACSCDAGYSGSGYRRTNGHNFFSSPMYNVHGFFFNGCTDINECAGNPCGAGTCSELDPNPGYTCSCNTGYDFDGDECVNENECVTMPGVCGVGTCSDENPPDFYECTCPAGWDFNGTTCVVSNPCTAGTDDCDRNAECEFVGGRTQWICTCDDGFLGTGSDFRGTGDMCEDIDECREDRDICGVGACRNNSGGYTCTCPDGYFFDGTTCQDVDECRRDPCGVGGRRCRNMPGTYTCDCRDGYEFAGGTCEDIDECATDPCGRGECTQTEPPGYSCSCEAGFAFNGVTCRDIDECSMPEVSLCAVDATCSNSPGSFRCTCNEGFEGDGRTCLDIQECMRELDDCDVHALCTNTVGSYTCACSEGYRGSGVTCTDINECLEGSASCGRNEVCVNVAGAPYECDCAPGYTRFDEEGPCEPACGDGERTPGEECDDGNMDDEDGCDSSCVIEPGWACYEPSRTSECEFTCGDGLVQPSEECDRGELNADEPDTCRTTCKAPACGDGILDADEECDPGEMELDDEAAGACRTSCREAYCGDGVIDEGEDCDFGVPGGETRDDCVTCEPPAEDAGVVLPGADAGVREPMGEDDGGCGCAAPGAETRRPWAVLGLALLFVWRRRRAR